MSKTEIESCHTISVFWLKQYGYLPQRESLMSGGIKWSNRWGEETSSIGFTVRIRSPDNPSDVGHVKLSYRHTNRWSSELEQMDYRVPLTATPCNYGGFRYWFTCPWYRNGIYCGNRVAVLYNISKFFACRRCGNLIYMAQNTNGPLRSMISKVDLERAQEAIKHRYYNGKPTRKYKSYMNKLDKYHRQWIIAERYLSSRIN